MFRRDANIGYRGDNYVSHVYHLVISSSAIRRRDKRRKVGT